MTDVHVLELMMSIVIDGMKRRELYSQALPQVTYCDVSH